jgi:transcriptional regulator with PAS, ATPase and Fis domain
MEHVIERAMLLARGQIAVSVEHLPGEFRARTRHRGPAPYSDEPRHARAPAHRAHPALPGGNRTRAAKELGISRATLINKIKLYAIVD